MKKVIRKRSLKISITNNYADGCYTAPVYVGSQRTPVNVFLDTGSSTLAISQNHYHADKDRYLKPTHYAQHTAYLDGSYWTGAVINTRLAVRHNREAIKFNGVNIATIDHQKSMFSPHMQGILGLAYKDINYAYIFKKPTWPDYNHKNIEKRPYTEIAPYFTQLEENGTLPNKFSLYTLRSELHYGNRPLDKDPLNQGYLVLGGGEEYRSLYDGDFLQAKIQHDYYYNTHISSVRVGNSKPVKVGRPLSSSGLYSNSIVDSGTSTICFPTWLHKKIIDQFHAINPNYIKAIYQSATYDNIKLSPATIKTWPDIYFTMEGLEGNDIELCVKPQTYWQANCTQDGVAYFAIDSESENQTILGLPFINNYYTIFDRSARNGIGTIKFATPKAP
ncbi:MAG: pepsin-like aspartyl protease [Arenicellales bacterium]